MIPIKKLGKMKMIYNHAFLLNILAVGLNFIR